MKEKVLMDKYTCDSPDCDQVRWTPRNDITEAFGFHGTVKHITPTSGRDAEWFACKREHIESAVFNALRTADS